MDRAPCALPKIVVLITCCLAGAAEDGEDAGREGSWTKVSKKDKDKAKAARRLRQQPQEQPPQQLPPPTQAVRRAARPAPFASRSARRALLMPQVNAGSLYRGGKGT